MQVPLPGKSDDALLDTIWDYMVIETPLQHADVIIVGGSTDTGAAQYAAELYGMNFAPLIVFSGYQQPGMDMSEAELFAKTALSFGVPESAILREPQAVNTGQNITFSQQLLAEKGIVPKTVILVHKPYMARRFLATAEAQWEGEKPVFITRHESIGRPGYTLRRGRGEVIRKLLGDFQRMRPYGKKGYQSPQEIPEEVQAAYNALLYRGHKTR
ncbi:MAG TPA: YdcF family protein [Candidatus Saccharimonadales bacterium]|nr:YdcF family protein [Candidatus Saccharimonadales bacterium]